MRCPREFSVQLEPQQRLGVEVDHCPHCAGLWLDAGELELILSAMEPAPMPSGLNESSPSDEAPTRCPRCGAVAVLLAAPPVKVNLCSACHGLWLDALELEALSALHAAGKLDGFLRTLREKTEFRV